MFGDVDLDDYYLRRLAVDLKMTIVNVEYRYAYLFVCRLCVLMSRPA